ncbi:MAG TPA: T9SS type A sorting domain-containing protein [Chitinophagaceae bacterium]|nr:T9SS type A sorting domain-containing protein [Chitinophagaceae bacterium]
MRKFYSCIPVLLCISASIYFGDAQAQNCNSLQVSYTTTESRCISTGSITVTVTGGSGSYNFQAEGPVNSPITSSNVITGLEPGTYKITVRDVNSNCKEKINNIVVTGSYADPRFELTKKDVSCIGNDGSINVANVQNGLSPFVYEIVAPSASNVGAKSTTGEFTQLAPGQYSIQLQDSCGGIQVRLITIEDYNWWFDRVQVTKVSCDSSDALIYLVDNKGNLNSSSSFNGFMYGIVNGVGDTTWKSSNSFRFYSGTKRAVTFVAKDNCGTRIAYNWSIPQSLKPAIVSSLSKSNRSCTNFDVAVTGFINLTNPQFCLVDENEQQLNCNTTGIFYALDYGSYCIKIRDNCYDTTINVCFTESRPVPYVNADVNVSDRTCTSFTAKITGQTNLINPQYCLFDNGNTELTCNTTGIFPSLAYGTYKILIKNGCNDTTLTREFSADVLTPVLTNVQLSGANCTSFNAKAVGSNLINPQYCLYDSSGVQLACNTTGEFSGLDHGSYCIKAISCSDTTAPFCFTGTPPKPAVGGTVLISNKVCEGFTATVFNQSNLTNPTFDLVDDADSLIAQNTTGVFNAVPYGSYCIKLKDGCVDTTIKRCFSVARPTPTIKSELVSSDFTCTSFKATVSGTNLTRPQYSIYDSLNNLVATNNTGEFPGLAYGSYCAEIRDSCMDTTLRVCKSVTIDKTIKVTASRSCTFNYTSMQVVMSSPNPPYVISVYHPDGDQVYTTATSNATTIITSLPALPGDLQYKVVGSDKCNNMDSVLVTPIATEIDKTITTTSKCPSSTWQNGSGDLTVKCTSNYYPVSPAIIKKNGAAFNLNYSSKHGNKFVFSDLGPGTYIVQYSVENCIQKAYDTVTVNPYTFPNQNKSAIYQCNDNSLSLGAVVSGGVSPFQYEIIGSTPNFPSIARPKQAAPVFSINNGTKYSLIRLRSIDACGNAALNDVSVLPLQHIGVSASANCMYDNITLSVDTIPHATYEWYYKRSDTDSTLVGDSLVHSIPMLQPEETGTYVCKASVNDNCLTRLAYFNLDGECGHLTLASSIYLSGKRVTTGNQLRWTANAGEAAEFVVERKTNSSGKFTPIGKLQTQSSGAYLFIDSNPENGTNVYRLNVIGNRKSVYSNLATISWQSSSVLAYPNPVKDQLHVSIVADSKADYNIELFNSSGQIEHREQLMGVKQHVYTYRRNSVQKPGVYLLKVTNRSNFSYSVYRLLFE